MTQGYAIEHEGRVFTPDGQASIADVEAHNTKLEADELLFWQIKVPDRWQVYVTNATVGASVTTWRGKVLGTITQVSRYQTNISRNMVAITFRGTNGATYCGRYGDDWSQLCRVRRCKG